jgi:hypothetical protein
MAFETQADAKRFIVEKVLEQARIEGINLSEAERYDLSWSESDPDFKVNYELAEAREDAISSDEYEAKVASLIRNAFERDIAADPNVKSLYREAYEKRNEGDHYILIMMKSAIGSKLGSKRFKWWPF